MEYKWREVEERVKKWMDRDFSVILVGPRQAGKTTLLKHLSEERKIPYFSLDDPDVLRSLRDIKSFARSLRSKKFCLDEAQYDPEIGRKLKYLHDVEGFRFVASGSGSFDVKVKVSGELVGRAARIELLPLNFHEFVVWNDEELAELHKELREISISILSGNEDEFPLRSNPFLERLWQEYVVYGGYPRVVLAQNYEEKVEILKQILVSYLDRDVFGFLGVREHTKFIRVLEALARIVGGLLNKNHVAEVSNTSLRTVEGYLSILEQTFVLFRVFQYSSSLAGLRKRPKLYFYDTGLRNVVISDFRHINERDDLGRLLENFVARHLVQYFERVYFWRDKSGEIDFIVKNVPVEVKTTKRRSKLIYRVMESLESPHGVIIRLGDAEKKDGLYFIPPWFL